MSDLADIAQAVTDELNDVGNDPYSGLSQTFVAERSYRPIYDSTTDTQLRVFVWSGPVSLEADQSDRENDFYDYAVNVGIYKKVKQQSIAEADELANFAEEVLALLQGKTKLTHYDGDAQLDRSKTLFLPYDPEQMDKFSVYVSKVTLVYRLYK